VQSGRPIISDLHMSPLTSKHAVAVTVPVRRDGEIRWFLTARLSTEHLSELLRRALVRPEALSVITDSAGRVVARSRDLERYFSQPASVHYPTLNATAPRGIARTRTVEGRDVVSAWERLDNDAWTVGMALPVEVYAAPLGRSMLAIGLAGVAAIALGLAAAFRLSQRIARAVNNAALDAHLLADERMVPPRRSRIDELHSLLDAQHRASLRLAAVAAERNHAARKLHRAMERLREEARGRDRFLAMLGHELRNPLAPIVNATRLMKAGPPLSPLQQRGLDIVVRQTSQLVRLVNDLLDVSRVTSGKIRLQREPVSLTASTRELADEIRPEVEAAAQRLIVELPAEPLTAFVDDTRIRQVLMNLLGNAMKFGQSGGTITVRLARDRGDAVLTVDDEGIGIDPARLGELFRPFSQIDPGIDRANGGLGLGLVVVRQLVEMHGGSIDAASAGLGHGARFTVRLPLGAPPDATGDATEAVAQPATEWSGG
jgi:signal transduction histidine kinase